jgi:hypothetical protein
MLDDFYKKNLKIIQNVLLKKLHFHTYNAPPPPLPPSSVLSPK